MADFIALTHKHATTVAAAPAAITAALAGADEDALDLTVGRRAGHYPSDYTVEPVAARPVEHGMSLPIGDARLEVHATPGHTSDHHALTDGSDHVRHAWDALAALRLPRVIT